MGSEVHVFAPAETGDPRDRFRVHVVPGGESGDSLKAALGVRPSSSIRSRLPRGLAPAAGKVLNTVKEWAYFPDTARSWARDCASALASWLDVHDCDVIVSSSPPMSAHVAVHDALRGRGNGPAWIADFRDLWTQNPHYDYGRMRASRDRKLERVLIDDADAVTVTTAEMGRLLEAAYPDATIVPIYNGCDERLTARQAPARPDRPLTITHAGYLYEGRRSVEPLLRALGGLIAEGAVDRGRIRLRFAGPPDGALADGVARYGLSDVVDIVGVVARAELPALLADSDVLLVVTWDPERESSLIPAKTFEYLGARRPILALNCSAEGELGRLLAETGAGACAESVDDVRAAMKDLYSRHVAGTAQPCADPAAMAGRTQERMASRFSDLAQTLVRRGGRDVVRRRPGGPRAVAGSGE